MPGLGRADWDADNRSAVDGELPLVEGDGVCGYAVWGVICDFLVKSVGV